MNAGLRAALVAVLLSGCAAQTGLYNPRTERVCLDRICAIRADAELVNQRCTERKSAWKKCQDDPKRPECANATMRWDDGTTDPSKRARCCTVLRPKRYGDELRYWIWQAAGEEDCWMHEEGHIQVYEKDGFRFVQEHHRALHGFGLGREKKQI